MKEAYIPKNNREIGNQFLQLLYVRKKRGEIQYLIRKN
ncbi:hypothetical protein BSI_11850 [Bacillus inaquosorum KCTC 13429]|uniref:Uncharacterized protein n=1 Tax=Bacillus inaquosorum KCTC 13429 TaxID=1236548 RepID=A0A9W5LK87_9BACI|nr:hypothetical protein BSI_11850 [Bacillus inaquosorum KCTC 13429]